ncbi:hybrid sensor histidine kinase/response regulator [Arcobacteraceae bacterium]|nr:hybrid sensor histidine kinase/response regulator [Arcobacteraceae bacterium]
MDTKYTILAVDDKIENLAYLNTILNETYTVRATPNSKMALESISYEKPDLILLDIKMPEIDGFEVCKTIKKDDALAEIPIIFISALDDINHKVEAFENGGVDYITKPFEPREVKARIKTQLEIFESKRTIDKLLKQQDMFVKKIMHEINTPLSIISLNCDSLEREIGSKDEVEVIKASTKTLSSIYSDLSYIIKKESRPNHKTKINLLKFISSRIAFFDELANVKDIFIELESANEYEILFNEYELERIIDNTISNSIKYSNKSSTINIFVGIENNNYILEIKDEGVGMEKPDEVFLPYFQQSTSNIGLGLGLSIVKEICDKYEVKIEVTSVLSKGTTIRYDFSQTVGER